MKRIIILALVMLMACKSRRHNCTVYASDILRNYPKKVYIIRQDKNKILGVEDYGHDKTKAGAYYFFRTGSCSIIDSSRLTAHMITRKNMTHWGNWLKQLVDLWSMLGLEK